MGLALLVLLLRLVAVSNTAQKYVDPANINTQMQLLPASDLQSVSLGGTTIELTDDWSISARLANTSGTEWECLNANCEVFIVRPTSSASSISALIFSYPDRANVRLMGDSNIYSEPILIDGLPALLYHVPYEFGTTDSAGTETITITGDVYQQLSICFVDSPLCVQTDLLSDQKERNLIQEAEFITLMSNLRISSLSN